MYPAKQTNALSFGIDEIIASDGYPHKKSKHSYEGKENIKGDHLSAKQVKSPMEKMRGTLQKSIDENYGNKALFTAEMLFNRYAYPVQHLAYSSYESKGGYRKSMEDRHFILDNSKELLIGVFDGHGGDATADYLMREFAFKFFSILQKAESVFHAFRKTCAELQEGIASLQCGSTAVVTYIKKEEAMAYTMTLGDSDAKIFRMIGEKLIKIPLACLRNWSSEKDIMRAKSYQQDIDLKWEGLPAKERRFPYRKGINVSRAFGTFSKAVSQNCKVTACPVENDDLLLLTSDGVSDYMSDEEIANIISRSAIQSLAKEICKCALKTSKDNVTAVAMRIFTSQEGCYPAALAPNIRGEKDAEPFAAYYT